jgi:FkbM family methyltransferase
VLDYRAQVTGAEQPEVFSRFVAGCRTLPNWIGVTTRREFFVEDLRFVTVVPPPPDAELFEWIDVLEAVTRAAGAFTMFELGAGYGRWIVNAAAALRAYSGLPHSLTAVEAEPTHFRWLEDHCRDNDVDAKLVQAAVAPGRGSVQFGVGQPASWYGQAIADGTWSPERVVTVDAITLSDLLEPLERVDLIHCDIQGAEAAVFEEAASFVDAKVQRVHVGTHGQEVELRLRQLFSSLGWENVNDYAGGTSVETPWGTMDFQDGVQTWLNPPFALNP